MLDGDRLWNDLLTHASFGEKTAGSAGDLETARWIASELSRAGYELETIPVPVAVFRPRRAELVGQWVSLEVYPQPVVTPTTDQGVEGQLAMVHGLSDAREAAGRIAVILLPYARHAAIWTSIVGPLLEAVTESGALAAIILPFGPTGEIVGLNSYADRPFVPIPVAIGRPLDLPYYAEMASTGQTVRLYLMGKVEAGDSPTLIARMARSDRWIVMSTPRSGFFTCAVERGAGTAGFLEIARRLPGAFPDHSLFLMNSGAHELRFSGTHAALDLAPSPDQTDVWAHLGAGLASRARTEIRGGRMLDVADPNRICMTTPALHEAAGIAFAGLPGLDDPQQILPEAGELSTIAARGYEKAFACLGVNWSCHTRLDLPTEVSPNLLLPVIEAHWRLIEDAVRKSSRPQARAASCRPDRVGEF
jgi:hypothetical protein